MASVLVLLSLLLGGCVSGKVKEDELRCWVLGRGEVSRVSRREGTTVVEHCQAGGTSSGKVLAVD